MTTTPERRTRLETLDKYIVAVAAAAVAAFVAAAAIDLRLWRESVSLPAVGLFATMLVVGEMHSTGWLRLRNAGEVTAGWAFAFAILLLGSPLLAMLSMSVASLLPDLIHRKGLRRTAFNASQTVLALFAATVVLTLSGFHRPISITADYSVGWMAATLGAAVAIFLCNSVLTCVVIALNLGVSITSIVRRASGLSVSADGALLVLSPLFVIAADFSLVTVPLLGLIAFLVYNSARQALEREHRASHDHLTDLLNAPAFHDHVNGNLDASRSRDACGCVLLLDLDGFKNVNDRLGHQTGDEVLRQVADLITGFAAREAIAARLGGDEFAVLLPDVATLEQALEAGAELARRLCAPLDIKGFPLSTSASIGAVLLDRSITSSEEALRHADEAMYRAKRQRTTVEVYISQAATDMSGGRISLLPDLARALERDELTLAYQPQVHARTGAVHAMEALVRWDHPTLGRIMPNDYIGLAEHTDLIDALTVRVLELACRDSRTLNAAGSPLRVAVNISTHNLRQRHFPETVARIVADHGVDPSMIELEVTESAFAMQQDVVLDVIEGLRAMGFGLAMDDFGSGYSSFSRLLETPVHALKIDRSLISDIAVDDRNFLVIKTILDLCRSLGLTSIAEGVENIETIHQLAAIGCDLVQGYAIARPMAVGDAARWLADRPAGVAMAMGGAL